MRVSSVCAQVPMFGVSAVFFYGIGVCHIGVPSTALWLPPGPEDDHVVLRAQVRRCRGCPSDRCSRTGICRCRTPGATSPRSACWSRCAGSRCARRAPDASSPTAPPRARRPSARARSAALSRSACDTPLMTNEPRLNFVPADVERLLRHLDVGVLQLVAQRDQRVVGVVVDREDAAGARRRRSSALTSPFTSSIGASSTFDVGHADGLHAEAPRGTSSRCRRTGAPADRSAPRYLIVEQRVGDARVRLIHADDVAAGRELARASAAAARAAWPAPAPRRRRVAACHRRRVAATAPLPPRRRRDRRRVRRRARRRRESSP